jgi:hypothetical protein
LLTDKCMIRHQDFRSDPAPPIQDSMGADGAPLPQGQGGKSGIHLNRAGLGRPGPASDHSLIGNRRPSSDDRIRVDGHMVSDGDIIAQNGSFFNHGKKTYFHSISDLSFRMNPTVHQPPLPSY